MVQKIVVLVLLAFAVQVGVLAGPAEDDPYLWLEEIDGDAGDSTVGDRDAPNLATLKAVPEFEQLFKTNLEIYNSDERIPNVGMRGDWLYNFWRDADHVRGLWRRTTLASYKTDDPEWETVIDLDALAEAEDENWVWKGSSCLAPAYRLCMVALSRGGGDATVRREFDTVKKAFVENGFILPDAKSTLSRMDSGYPRIAKKWKRGTPLEAAETIFEGEAEDVSVNAYSIHTPEGRYDLVTRTPQFFRGTNYLILGDRLVKLGIPEDASMQEFIDDQMLFSLRSDWSVGGVT